MPTTHIWNLINEFISDREDGMRDGMYLLRAMVVGLWWWGKVTG